MLTTAIILALLTVLVATDPDPHGAHPDAAESSSL